MICQILSDEHDDLWSFKTNDGRGIQQGIEFLFPFVADKSRWPFKKDVMYWDSWPVAHPFMLFGAREFNNKEWFENWKKLDHDPTTHEVIRNLPVRNPIIWLEK